MITSGTVIVASDGLHDDGWCWPQTRMRIRAIEAASELRIGIWLKPEETGQARTLFTYGSDAVAAKAEFVTLGQPTELVMSVNLSAGEEADLRISTPHRASRGEDVRDLSFIMTSITLI